jgi:hypothetical protein
LGSILPIQKHVRVGVGVGSGVDVDLDVDVDVDIHIDVEGYSRHSGGPSPTAKNQFTHRTGK